MEKVVLCSSSALQGGSAAPRARPPRRGDFGVLQDAWVRGCPPSGCPPPGLCVAFNVDVRDPQLFLGPPEAQFGYKVLQRVDGGEKW